MKKLLILILFVCISVVLSAQKGFKGCIDSINTRTDTAVDFVYLMEKWKDCVIGKPLPDINFKTVAGKKVSAKGLKGKVVVLNFWFIECHPCIAELPALNKLVNEYKNKEVLFYGITYQPLTTLKRDFFPKYKFDFQIVADATNITDEFAAGYPTTYIVDKNGIIKAAWNGGIEGEQAETQMFLKAKPIIDELLLKN